MAYQLWMVKLIRGVDPNECDYGDAWIWGQSDNEVREEGWYG